MSRRNPPQPWMTGSTPPVPRRRGSHRRHHHGFIAFLVTFLVIVVVGGYALKNGDSELAAVPATTPASTITTPTPGAQTPESTPSTPEPSSPEASSSQVAAAVVAAPSSARPTVRATTSQPGTALALLATIPTKGRAPKTGYSRAQFGQAWADVDHNGCDTRNDILHRDLTGITVKAGTHDCVVLSGTLADSYSGTSIHFRRGVRTSTAIQIDHVVALSDAWQKGAQQLPMGRRVALANDPFNLLAVSGPLNEQKGDGDAATWLPPNKAFRCQYVARQVAVKSRYHLWMTPAEHSATESILKRCPATKAPTSAPIVVTGAMATAMPTTHAATKPRPRATKRATSRPTTKPARPGGSLPVVHGGSFCSTEGARGVSSAGNVLTCKPGSDGRLRWKK